MKTLILALLMLILPGCATMRLMNEIKQESESNVNAWMEAKRELRWQCAQTPEICSTRLMLKYPMKGYASLDDWGFENLPPYKVTIDTHETILRKARGDNLRIPEELLFALAKTLGERVENGEITPDQMKHAFTEAWNKMLDEVVKDLTRLLQEAKKADDETVKVVTTVAVVVGVVATAALVASAAAPQPTYQYVTVQQPPRPVYCNAYRSFSSIRITCY
jgi:hypothetical protein